ncbi:MAG: hypothetical protein H7Z16_09070 [Pyrinomonadaceae bacterium]|nr:hypothetical protein [Pyrinomonadaceae bacterium]
MTLTLNDDKVWFDEAHKLDHICVDVFTAQENGHSVIVLSHFESTVASLAVLLREKGTTYGGVSPLNLAELCISAPGRVWLGLARAFQVGPQMTSQARSSTIEIIVAEHHPMHSRDQEIVDAAAKLACDAQVSFYFSLDDPVMTYFGATSIKALFERLGVDKSECLSNHLINTAVRTAQEKIESEVGKDLPAHSAADWFKYNLQKKK